VSQQQKELTRRGARSRQSIIAAAMSVIAEQGSRASLASIGAVVNMTAAGLLHHFGSKNNLLLAVLEERDRIDAEMLRAIWEEGQPFLETLETLVDLNQTKPELVQLFTVLVGESASPKHPAHDHFARRYADRHREALEVLQNEQRAGEIRSDVDLEEIVVLELAVMDGLQIQWCLDSEVDMAARFRAFTRILRQAIMVEPVGRPRWRRALARSSRSS